MTLWQYLDRRAERRARLAAERPVNIRLLANVIGCSLIFGFLGALATLFVIPIPSANEQLLTYMIGQLSGFAGGIIAYHYTSKAGEAELDAKRAENTGKLADAITAAAQATPAAAGEPKPDVILEPGETAQAKE